jgi:DNA helicase HerA-like ATPase
MLDEANLWAPQPVQLDGYDLLGRIEEIVRRGRARGFVPWLISQRPAVLHKDVLSQADILVSMKLTSSQGRAAVGRWIEGQADQAEGRRILATLPRLGRAAASRTGFGSRAGAGGSVRTRRRSRHRAGRRWV